jgi:DNA-binding MarR family transcriptional regulator
MQLSPARELLELFRHHQRASQFVEQAFESSLTLVETYALLEVSIDPSATHARLAYLIGTEEQAIARAMRRLRAAKLLSTARSKSDNRKYVYSLQQAGEERLNRLFAGSRSFLRERLTHLSASEIAVLQRLLNRVCDSVIGPPVILHRRDHPFEHGIRRITRSLGFVGGSLFGSGYSSTVWQLLSAVNTAPEVTLSSLGGIFPLPTSTLSQLLARYLSHGWLRKRGDTGDGRKRIYTLTKAGINTLESIYTAGERLLDTAFPADERRELITLVDLFKRYLEGSALTEANLIRPAFSIRQVSGPEERGPIRAFIIYNLVRSHTFDCGPEHVASKTGEVFLLMRGNSIAAALDFYPSTTAASTDWLCTFTHDGTIEDFGILKDFLKAGLARLSKTHPTAESISIPLSFIPRELISTFPLQVETATLIVR